MDETERALRALSDKIAARFKYFINEKQLTEVITTELLPLFNAGIVGAYAAAANEAGFRVRFLITGTPDEQAAHMESCILALTPADARQSQTCERMDCGHLKADEQEYFICCDVWGSDHKTHTNPIEQAIGSTFKCRTCTAIASAEARARLEAAKLCDEMGRNGKGLFEASEALYKLAAARTPDNTKEQQG